jgi:PEP-CTERM motif-containing protein
LGTNLRSLGEILTMKRTLSFAMLLGTFFPASLFAGPITFNLRDPYIESIDEVNSFDLTIDGLVATLQALPETYSGYNVVLNQTSSAFGINVDKITCNMEDSSQVDGGCTGELLGISFSENVYLNSLRVSSFGSTDQGLVTVDGTATVPLTSTGLVSLGNIYLAAGDVWTVSYLAGNGFSVDNFTVSTVPEASTLVLLTTALIGVVYWRRRYA